MASLGAHTHPRRLSGYHHEVTPLAGGATTLVAALTLAGVGTASADPAQLVPPREDEARFSIDGAFQLVAGGGFGYGVELTGAFAIGRGASLGFRGAFWGAWYEGLQDGSVEAGVAQLVARWLPGGGIAYVEGGAGAIAFHTFYSSEVVPGRTRVGLMPGLHVGVGLAPRLGTGPRLRVGVGCDTILVAPAVFHLPLGLVGGVG
jgi:hypothetical protein